MRFLAVSFLLHFLVIAPIVRSGSDWGGGDASSHHFFLEIGKSGMMGNRLIRDRSETIKKSNSVPIKKEILAMGDKRSLGAGKGEGTDSVSWALYHPAPVYPKIAREKGWKGSVQIRISTDHKGRVISEKIAKSSGFIALDEAAFEAIKRWRTYPNLENELVPIVFNLREF